jgi:hypothetical protein
MNFCSDTDFFTDTNTFLFVIKYTKFNGLYKKQNTGL